MTYYVRLAGLVVTCAIAEQELSNEQKLKRGKCGVYLSPYRFLASTTRVEPSGTSSTSTLSSGVAADCLPALATTTSLLYKLFMNLLPHSETVWHIFL